MKAHAILFVTLLLAVALVTAGCSFGRRSSKPPRQQMSDGRLSADFQAMRYENEALRKRQQENEKQLAELRSMLARSQEEQRRFKEAMSTNFDLLEQSVALTLSKTIATDMSRMNEASAAQPQAVAAAQPKTAPPSGSGMKTGSAPAASSSSAAGPVPRSANTRAESATAGVARMETPPAAPSHSGSMPSGGVQKTALGIPGPGSGNGAPGQALDDPDLIPPASPIRLSPHRDAKALYEKGFALFARRKYDQSIIVFGNFLNRFPNDIYSDNAQFWIGESYLRMKRPEQAEAAYRKVLRNYEHRSTLEGYKTPDAIYRIGQGHRKRKEYRKARYYFQVLAERFPDSSAGRRANNDLVALGMKTAAN